jgi:hypothetical protein
LFRPPTGDVLARIADVHPAVHPALPAGTYEVVLHMPPIRLLVSLEQPVGSLVIVGRMAPDGQVVPFSTADAPSAPDSDPSTS